MKQDDRAPEDLAVRSQTGGFMSQVRPDLARCVVLYLETEDPGRPHRKKLVCAINIANFELRHALDPNEPERSTSDGRTQRRKMWDDAVESLVRIAGETGMNPKLVRNDKNACRLVLRQDAQESNDMSIQLPDEFFEMTLAYWSEFELERRKLEYVRRIAAFDNAVAELRAKLFSWKTPKGRRKELSDRIAAMEREKRGYLSATPDPRELDSGLILTVELYTLKEYCLTREMLKTVLGRFLDGLSRLAGENEASGGMRRAA